MLLPQRSQPRLMQVLPTPVRNLMPVDNPTPALSQMQPHPMPMVLLQMEAAVNSSGAEAGADAAMVADGDAVEGGGDAAASAVAGDAVGEAEEVEAAMAIRVMEMMTTLTASVCGFSDDPTTR